MSRSHSDRYLSSSLRVDSSSFGRGLLTSKYCVEYSLRVFIKAANEGQSLSLLARLHRHVLDVPRLEMKWCGLDRQVIMQWASIPRGGLLLLRTDPQSLGRECQAAVAARDLHIVTSDQPRVGQARESSRTIVFFLKVFVKNWIILNGVLRSSPSG